MGIRFYCPACHQKVNVKGHQAGLRGFCPKCRAKIDIPEQSTIAGKNGSNEPDEEPTAVPAGAAGELSISAILPHVGRLVGVHTNPPNDPLTEVAGALWYIASPEGGDPFGPADGSTVGLWLQQGRIASRSLVWRQDWSDWRKAGTVWSQLALNDVDPRAQRHTERARGSSPQFSVPQVPTTSATARSIPATLANRAQQAVPYQASAVPSAVQAQAATYRNPPLTAVPAAVPPPAPPSSGQPDDELYYPPRQNTLYLVIVGVLLVGLIGMGIALYFVLQQLQHHKQPQSPNAATTVVEPAPAANATPAKPR